MSKKDKGVVEELDSFLKENEKARKDAKVGRSNKNGKEKEAKERSKAKSVQVTPRAPFRVHAMGLKNDAYCKVMQEDTESLSDAMRIVEEWAEKDAVKELILHIR